MDTAGGEFVENRRDETLPRCRQSPVLMASPVPDVPFIFSAGMAMPGVEGGGAPFGTQRSADSSAEDLVRQTRREIGEIVREVADLARRRIAPESFFSALLDRTTRALAAEGAVLWDLAGQTPRPILRTGRVTDHQIVANGRAAHNALLDEVAASGSPVVVPPTPVSPEDDWVSDQPANPTDRPAAVVPIPDPLAGESARSRYLLEVFLEPDAGVATQRGYLRFTVQMADLAGDFLRLDELRRGRADAEARKRLAAALPRIHRHDRIDRCAAEIVDVAAELLGASRVTLVQLPPCPRANLSRDNHSTASQPGHDFSGDGGQLAGRAGRSHILAISHIESIDHRGAACRALRESIAALKLMPGQVRTFTKRDQSIDQPADQPTAGQGTGALSEDAPLVAMLAVSLGDDDRYRLFAQSNRPMEITSSDLEMIRSFSSHAWESLRSIERIAAVPLARTWLSLFGTYAGGESTRAVWVKRLLVTAVAATTLAVVAMLPKSMTVSVPASLRPANVRMHYAPSDAVVRQVLVRHGDSVVSGQPLIVLNDLSLDEQTSTLISRRAVVSEKLARVVSSLVELPASGIRASGRDSGQTSDEALIQQQRLLEEEQRAIDQQLELLEQARERLVIRADRAGTVDAWQTELAALGRPVRTGELLIRVQPTDSSWAADARIPQNRRQLVMRRLTTSDRPVDLRIGDREGEVAAASFSRQIGFEASPTGGPPMTVVELAIDDRTGSDSPSAAIDPTRWRNGMPVEVMVDCGEMPLVKVLFFDLIRNARLHWEKWR